nr:hypothetical protein [Lachnospiraceae bacterium]
RYGFSEDMPSDAPADVVLEEIARIRGCLKKGEEKDRVKAAGILLDDFRDGRLGRITLENIPAQDETVQNEGKEGEQ